MAWTDAAHDLDELPRPLLTTGKISPDPSQTGKKRPVTSRCSSIPIGCEVLAQTLRRLGREAIASRLTVVAGQDRMRRVACKDPSA